MEAGARSAPRTGMNASKQSSSGLPTSRFSHSTRAPLDLKLILYPVDLYSGKDHHAFFDSPHTHDSRRRTTGSRRFGDRNLYRRKRRRAFAQHGRDSLHEQSAVHGTEDSAA